jgi:hypothetical protein
MSGTNSARIGPFSGAGAGEFPLDDDPMQGASSRKRPTRSDSPPRAVKGRKQKPRRKVGPEDEDRRVLPGEAGANDD